MRDPSQINSTVIKSTGDVVTNADEIDLSQNFALKKRGLRNAKSGVLFERDFGSQHIYPVSQYPRSPLPAAIGKDITLVHGGLPPTLRDASTGKYHNVFIGYDKNPTPMARVFVDANGDDSQSPDWQDMTRIVKATISALGNPIRCNKTSVTENMSEQLTTVPNEFRGWVIHNITRAMPRNIISISAGGDGRINVHVPAHGGKTGEYILIAGVVSSGIVNGRWTITVVDDDNFTLDDSVWVSNGSGGTATFYDSTSLLCTGYNNNHNATEVSFSVMQNPVALGWKVGDVLHVYRSRALINKATVSANGVGYSLGNDFIVTTNTVEAQRKMNCMIAKKNTNGVYEGTYPLRLQRNDTRLRFKNGTSTELYSLPSGWSLEETFETPFFGRLGNSWTTTRLIPGDRKVLEVHDIEESMSWLRIDCLVGTGTTIYRGGLINGTHNILGFFGYFVLKYDGYQLSNPVAQFFTAAITGGTPKIGFILHISPALMNQRVTGLQIYATTITEQEWNAGVGTTVMPSHDSYKLVKEISFETINDPTLIMTVNSLSPSHKCVEIGGTVNGRFEISPNIGEWQRDYITVLTNPITIRIPFQSAIEAISFSESIVGALGRIPLTEGRKIIKPRFIIRLGRDQRQYNYIDVDDNTLVRSVYGRGGIHFDDCYSVVEEDESVIRLSSAGEILGIRFIPLVHPTESISSQLVVFKPTETELFNIQSRQGWILPVGCSSRKSITSHTYGIAWASREGLYDIRGDGRQANIVNRLTLNEYDGTLKLSDNVTPVTTAAARNSVVGGFCLWTGEVLFGIEQNREGGGTEWLIKKYDVKNSVIVGERKFGNTNAGRAILGITPRSDSLVNILTDVGILKYPIIGSFEDEVLSDGTSQNIGYESKLVFNVGSLYSHSGVHTRLWKFLMQWKGVARSGAPEFITKFFANREVAPFFSQAQLVEDVRGVKLPRKINDRAGIERLVVEISLPPTVTAGELEIAEMTIEAKHVVRLGNN